MSTSARRLRRPLLWVGLVIVLVVLLAGAWLAVTALQARSAVAGLEADVRAVQDAVLDGDGTAAEQRLREVQDSTGRAADLTSGPVWSVAGRLPLLGDVARTATGLTAAADALATDVLPELVDVGPTLRPERLRVGPSTIDLEPLVQAQVPLGSALLGSASVRDDLAGLPDDGPVAVLTAARADLAAEVDELHRQLDRAETAVRLLPSMLGRDGPRSYFLAVQQPAEARGTGGLLGAYAIVRADAGALTVEGVSSRSALGRGTAEPVRPLPEGYRSIWEPWEPAQLWVNANVSPDFPQAAQNWLALYETSTGEVLDGAIAVDPYVVEAAVAATGPVQLSDGTVVTAEDAADYQLRGVYERYPGFGDQDDLRDDLLVELAGTALDRITSGGGDTRRLAEDLGRLVDEGRVLVAAPQHPAEQAELTTLRVGGALPSPDEAQIGLVLNDAGGSKLVPYLLREVVYEGGECADGRRQSTITVRLRNTAPADLPDYVTARTEFRPDQDPPPPAGQVRAWVSLYTGEDMPVGTVRLDGGDVASRAQREAGLRVITTTLTVDAGQERVLTYALDRPADAPIASVWSQPLVVPAEVEATSSPCEDAA